MYKWAATSLVLLIAILCGTIHGAVLREQQQPLDAVHQQAPDHINGTEKTDTDNAKSERPGPNPKTSELEESELYPAESELEASGEQARKKRQLPPKPEKNNTNPIKPTKPLGPDGNNTIPKNTNTSDPLSSMNATTGPTLPHSNVTKGPMPVNTNETGLYEPKDNPDIKRNYTSESVYWNDVTQTCHRKANDAEGKGELINDTVIVVIDSTKIGATAKKDSDNDTLFNDWSFCAKVQFYGNLGVIDARNYFGKEKATQKKEFSDMRDFENGGFMQDMVLLLIDGHIECKSAKEKMDVELSIVQDLEAGKLSELCGEEKMHEFGKTTVTLEEGTSYFVFGVVLRERLCPHNKVPEKVPNNTNDLVIEELKYKYENLKLTVEHKCMGEEKLVNIKLRPIDVFEMDNLDRVLQLRDLTLDLSMLKDNVMLEKGAEMKNPKIGVYYTASIGAGTDKNATNSLPDDNVETKMLEIEGVEMSVINPAIKPIEE
uniref:Uncharacterized protein n=1 Tax=Globodera rostochiensis TaxID=31243 RepID=A0A914HVD4_GLORO